MREQTSHETSTIGHRIDAIYQSALEQHQAFTAFDPEILKSVIEAELNRIDTFEQAARAPIIISPDVAETIGTIWVLSGTGTYDTATKPEDNPAFAGKRWMEWSDRNRLNRAALIARKIAEARSGVSVADISNDGMHTKRKEAKRLISQYGPIIVYNGFPVENESVRQVLRRDASDLIIPQDKVWFIDGNYSFTVDQVKGFAVPNNPVATGKDIVIVSHAPHTDRVLHMAGRYEPFPKGSVPYVSPVPTPIGGTDEAALMEIRGILYYTFLKDDATVETHPYRVL